MTAHIVTDIGVLYKFQTKPPDEDGTAQIKTRGAGLITGQRC